MSHVHINKHVAEQPDANCSVSVLNPDYLVIQCPPFQFPSTYIYISISDQHSTFTSRCLQMRDPGTLIFSAYLYCTTSLWSAELELWYFFDVKSSDFGGENIREIVDQSLFSSPSIPIWMNLIIVHRSGTVWTTHILSKEYLFNEF